MKIRLTPLNPLLSQEGEASPPFRNLSSNDFIGEGGKGGFEVFSGQILLIFRDSAKKD